MQHLLKIFLLILVTILVGFSPKQKPKVVENQWADSVFHSLTLDQKIGQLFMISVRSDQYESYYRRFDQVIQKYHIGGLIFFQGGPHRQVKLTNRFQGISSVPLLIGIDGEWGLGMRLDSVLDFPKQMTLGAITDSLLIRQMGAQIGKQCNRLGIHVNFAPVADINSNPQNPAIGIRSFGDNRHNVTTKAVAYMKGLQNQRVIATAKHFPGHGDTGNDSHFALPVITQSATVLDSEALYPFRRLIADSIKGVITGHLHVPALDDTPMMAASLSDKIVTGLLKNKMGFEGIVFTDALNMRGVSDGRNASEVNYKALLAGNDMLLCAENIAGTIAKIKTALAQGIITEELIDEKVKKILDSKQWVGLDSCQNIHLENLSEDLKDPDLELITQNLSENAPVLLQNTGRLLPITQTDGERLVSVAIGESYSNTFQKTLGQYANIKNFVFDSQPNNTTAFNDILAGLDSTQTLIVSLHDRNKKLNRPFYISSATIDFIQKASISHKVIVCLFGNVYSLEKIPAEVNAIVCGFENLPSLQTAVAQQIFGALAFKGKLPVSIKNRFSEGQGLRTNPTDRLIFGLPEQVGMDSRKLQKIDTAIQKAIQERMFPGCQVLVARKGRVVFQRNYGSLTYENPSEKVTNETLYDLASVTKVSATIQAVMFLNDRGVLDLKQKASFYLPELLKTNKENITVEDLLLHRSGMVAFYPTLWERTKTAGGGLIAEWYSALQDSVFGMQVAPKLFAKPVLADSVWQWIVASPMHQRRQNGRFSFVYSDLGLVVLQKITEKIINQPLNEFLEQNLYEPLGMKMTAFVPLNKFAAAQIAPTENDYNFRNQLLRGTVHDQMAAVLGGKAGHAGLFSCSYDLAILMQMNLQKGKYNEKRYFSEATLYNFTQLKDIGSHRGLGWDKPDGDSNYVSNLVSKSSFGHSGFTGTMVWVDTEKELTFVFLSNRVHPNANNNTLNRTKFRKRIQTLVYESLKP
jgi:beta-N-acetylhexosaminidase